MRKFIQGTFELDYDVKDLISYEESHKTALENIIDWSNDYEMSIMFGTSKDDTYLCEYDVICNTAAMCKGVVAELKHMLKSEFKKTKSVRQFSGNYLY